MDLPVTRMKTISLFWWRICDDLHSIFGTFFFRYPNQFRRESVNHILGIYADVKSRMTEKLKKAIKDAWEKIGC